MSKIIAEVNVRKYSDHGVVIEEYTRSEVFSPDISCWMLTMLFYGALVEAKEQMNKNTKETKHG